MKIKLYHIIKLFFFIVFNLLLANVSFAEKLLNFKISGNERLAKETIILFTELTIGEEIDKNDINNSFKKLFETNYFQNVKINFTDGILSIDL